MSETKKAIQAKQAANDGLFALTSLLDELNHHYKVVKMPTKEDMKKEQSNEVA